MKTTRHNKIRFENLTTYFFLLLCLPQLHDANSLLIRFTQNSSNLLFSVFILLQGGKQLF